LCKGSLSRQRPFLYRALEQVEFCTQLCVGAVVNERAYLDYDDGDAPGSPNSYLRQESVSRALPAVGRDATQSDDDEG